MEPARAITGLVLLGLAFVTTVVGMALVVGS